MKSNVIQFKKPKTTARFVPGSVVIAFPQLKNERKQLNEKIRNDFDPFPCRVGSRI